jgi:hypothetical protein
MVDEAWCCGISAFPLPLSVEVIERRRAARFRVEASDPEVV